MLCLRLAINLILKHKRKRSSFSVQPGWNEHVTESHKAARDSFVI